MTEIVVTYETIYEILRREKFRNELQKINQSFFDDVIKYIKEKKNILESQKSKDSIFSNESEKTNKQIESIKKILRELYEKRENKIIQLALFSSRLNKDENTTMMLNEEKELYTELKDILTKYRNGILHNILALEKPVIPTLETTPKTLKATNLQTNKLIKFIQYIPQFIGTDLTTYGPFETEDIANLPKEVADLLISKNRAEELSWK